MKCSSLQDLLERYPVRLYSSLIRPMLGYSQVRFVAQLNFWEPSPPLRVQVRPKNTCEQTCLDRMKPSVICMMQTICSIETICKKRDPHVAMITRTFQHGF